MSHLSRVDSIGPYDLIPVPMDVGNEEEENVACICRGFEVKNLEKVLQDFHRLPIDDVHSSLSELVCISCSHPLLKHRYQEQRQSTFDSLFELSSSFPVIEQPLNRELLQLSVGPCGTLVLVGVTNSHQDQPRLFVRWCELTASSNAGREPSVHKDLGIVDSKGGDEGDAPDVMPIIDLSSLEEPSSKLAKGRKRKGNMTEHPPRRSARITARNSACVPVALQSNIDLIEKEKKEERVKTDFVKSSLETCLRHTAEPLLLNLTELPLEWPVARYQTLALDVAWLHPSSGPPMLIVVVGTYDGRVIICTVCLNDDQPPSVHSSFSCPKNEDLEQMLTCLALDPPEANGEPGLTLICAGFGCGRLKFITIGMADEQRELVILRSSYCKDASSPVTKCCWSPNGRYLAAGTQHGHLMIYSTRQSSTVPQPKEGTEYILVSKVSCCAAAVTSLCWKHDGSSVVVGSCDNSLTVLTMSAMKRDSHNQNTLSKYFEQAQRVAVTCRLTGHLSAISNTVFFKEHLLSFGWDSRLLVWPMDCKDGSGELEPLSIFKLGPSLSAENVAQDMVTVGNCLLVAIYEKGGSVKIVLYHLQ